MNAAFRFSMLIVTIITIIENGCIVLFTFAYREIRNVPQSALIVSMSIADLLIGMIVMPLALYYEFNITWELGLVVCDFWISADIMCSTASILSIAFISIDKYFSLIHSSRYFGKERQRWVRLFVGVTWATSTFVAFSAGASGWARAKPLPPRDFHADLDQVIADWPLRVNFSNISLRQALEYVENLEAEAASQGTDDECTITNNPIFALYSGMVSFYLPATAILYFSCKIRWISALTLARHERITTQRMKLMKSKARKRAAKQGIEDVSDGDGDDDSQVKEEEDDDEAIFNAYNRMHRDRDGAKIARRSAMGLASVGKPVRPGRRDGILDAAEAAFTDELFSEASINTDLIPHEAQINLASFRAPQNSMISIPSLSSSMAPTVVGLQQHRKSRANSYDVQGDPRSRRFNSWGETMHRQMYEPWFIKMQDEGGETPISGTSNTAAASTATPAIAAVGTIHQPSIGSASTDHASTANRYNRKSIEASPVSSTRIYRNKSIVRGPSFRNQSGTNLQERQIEQETNLCRTPPPPPPSSSIPRNSSNATSSLRRNTSIGRHGSMRHRGGSFRSAVYCDDISMRFIDESTCNSYTRGEISADLLPLPNLPPGCITAIPEPAQRPSDEYITNANIFKQPTDNNSEGIGQLLEPHDHHRHQNYQPHMGFRERASSVLSKFRTSPILSAMNRNFTSAENQINRNGRKGSIITSPRASIRNKMRRFSTKLKNADAHGHLSAIGEYRTYMKALRRKERKTATLWLATVITFLGCWAPFFFCYPLSCFIEVPVELMILLPWLGYANSTINPILHAFVEPVYIKALARTIINILPPDWL